MKSSASYIPPLVRDPKTGTWKIERVVRQTAKKATLAADETDKYLVWLVVGSIGLCGLPFLPCYAPAALLVWYGRRYVVPPSGVWWAATLCVLLGTLPGLGGAIACTKGVAQYVADTYAPNLPQQFAFYWNAPDTVPAPLDSLWQPDVLAFALTLGPVWLALIGYIVWLSWHDARAIGARETNEKEQRQRTQTAIADGSLMALGQPRQRTWDAENQSWTIAPAQTDIIQADIVTLSPVHLARHTLIVAPTRAGKTANVIRPLITFCRRSHSAGLFFDPKGNDLDPALFTRNLSFQPDEAATSFRLCLIDPDLRPQEAAAKLAEGIIPETKPVYFSNTAREAFVAIMLLYYSLHGYFPELKDVLIYARVRRELMKLVRSVEENRTTTARLDDLDADVARQRYALEQDAFLAWTGLREALNEKTTDPLGSLQQALRPLASGRFVEYVTTKPDYGISIAQMLREKGVVRVAFSTDEGETGRMLGRIIIRLYTDFVLSPRADDSYLKLLVIDEAHNYLCQALVEGIPQSAGRNAGYVLAVQNLGQIRDVLGRGGAETIFANCKNRIVLAGINTPDAQTFGADMGRQALPTVTQSASESAGRSRGQSMSGVWSGGGSNRGASMGQSNSTSKGYILRDIWLPNEIAALPLYHALVRREDGGGEPEHHVVRFLTPDERGQLLPPQPRSVPTPLPFAVRASTPLDSIDTTLVHPTLAQPEVKTGTPNKQPDIKAAGATSNSTGKGVSDDAAHAAAEAVSERSQSENMAADPPRQNAPNADPHADPATLDTDGRVSRADMLSRPKPQTIVATRQNVVRLSVMPPGQTLVPAQTHDTLGKETTLDGA